MRNEREPTRTARPAEVVVDDCRMRVVYDHASRAASSSLSVLLLGETGVGKEVVAHTIHARSRRAAGPFIAVNCAAIAESLLESELFGAERGAYTGAVAGRAGLFEAAHGGTLFLDEVGEMPVAIQCKLLRVLEERAVLRVGSTRPRPVDLRVVAATNRDIAADAGAGRFRADLYFRLAGITLTIPPLRERPTEIEPLADQFVDAARDDLQLAAPVRLSEEALAFVRGYHWPGNIRELKNVIQRAAILCDGGVILPEHLPAALLGMPSLTVLTTPVACETDAGGPTCQAFDGRALQREQIVEALRRCAGNQTRAAQLLGISRGSFIARLSVFGLPRPRKRKAAAYVS